MAVVYEHIACVQKEFGQASFSNNVMVKYVNMFVCLFFFPLTVDIEGCDVLFICFTGADSLLQLALIKVNDVQTLIINCAAYPGA